MVKNILLTGTGGFVGKNLKEFLGIDYNLLTPRSFELDLSDEEAVSEYFNKNQIDFIIQCATIGGVRGKDDPADTELKNIRMIENIIKYKHKETKMILFGSGAMYDKSRELKKVKEDEIGKVIPKDLYGKSKLEIAKIVEKRDDILCLNIFGCYGMYEKESRVPTYAIMQNLKQEPIEFNQNVVFDYLYIDDLCRIISHFIEKFPNEKFVNVTPTESIEIVELAKIVNEISDYKSKIVVHNPGLNMEYTGDNTLLKNLIPGIKFTAYKDALKSMYNAFSEPSGGG